MSKVELRQFVTYSTNSDGIALVRIDRPKANALSSELLKQLAIIAKELVDTPPKAVVIYGGETIFAAGADISEFGGPAKARELGTLFNIALNCIAEIPRVTIAAINGYALGGGFELALACDFRIASRTSKLGQPELLLGVIPGGGATQRLPRLIGVSRAKELILSGRQVGAAEALEIGMIDRISEAGNTLSDSMEWALSFARGAVAAQGIAKAAIDQGISENLSFGLALERELFAQVFETEDSQIGVKSFLENGPGKAKFEGR